MAPIPETTGRADSNVSLARVGVTVAVIVGVAAAWCYCYRTVETNDIFSAASDGRVWIIQAHLWRGVDVNAKATYGDEGLTPLRYAVFSSMGDWRPAATAFLLRHGADPNAKDNAGNTALHQAVRSRPEAITLLMKHGADPKARNMIGWTPLNQPLIDPASVRLLVDGGADVNAKSDKGLTALHWAATFHRVSVCAALLDAGAAVDAKDSLGATPLHMCCEDFFDVSVEPDYRSFEQGLPSAPQVDADKSRNETALLLLQRGAQVNARDASGRTPLYYATLQSHASLCSLLLKHGAVKNTRSASGTRLSR